MNIISADQHQLLSFFEVEPILTDKDVPWPYNDYLYKVVRDDISISCAIAPALKDIRIILKKSESRIYELNSVGVNDIYYEEKNSEETLIILLNEADRLLLRIKPSIELIHTHDAAFKT